MTWQHHAMTLLHMISTEYSLITAGTTSTTESTSEETTTSTTESITEERDVTTEHQNNRNVATEQSEAPTLPGGIPGSGEL